MLAEELEALGAADVEPSTAACGFAGPFALCYAVNLESRVASRVLWQVAHGAYRSERDIYDARARLPWREWFSVDHVDTRRTSARSARR